MQAGREHLWRFSISRQGVMTDLQAIRDKLRSTPILIRHQASPVRSSDSMASVCAAAVVFAAGMLFTRASSYDRPPRSRPSQVQKNIEAGEPQSKAFPIAGSRHPHRSAALAGRARPKSARWRTTSASSARMRAIRGQDAPDHQTLDSSTSTTWTTSTKLMRCLITEAPARYCSASDRRMIAGEVVHYFRATYEPGFGPAQKAGTQFRFRPRVQRQALADRGAGPAGDRRHRGPAARRVFDAGRPQSDQCIGAARHPHPIGPDRAAQIAVSRAALVGILAVALSFQRLPFRIDARAPCS